MLNLPQLKKDDVYDKSVLIRCDTDVPIQNGIITSDLRLKSALTTVKFVIENSGRAIIIGHLGRPKGIENNLSLKPVADWFKKQLMIDSEIKEVNIDGFKSFKVSDKLHILENIRFFPQEEENDSEFSQKLSQLGQVFVNEAFAVSHRKHASIYGVAKILPHFAGFSLIKELNVLSNILENPERPLAIVIGGAKIETKLPLVKKMHQVADYILVAGEIAEQDEILLKIQHEQTTGRRSALLVGELNTDRTDITSKTVENFLQIINLCKTIVWNGPAGYIENPNQDTAKGTRDLARGIILTKAYTILGGGDTVGYLEKEDLLSQFSFVSMGGGAMLEFLSGEKLPGVEVLLEIFLTR